MTTHIATPGVAGPTRANPLPNYIETDVIQGGKSRASRVLVGVFVGSPLIAIVAAVPLAVIYGLLDWHAAVIAVAMYCITVGGIGQGFHRYFTHNSFEAVWALKFGLAVAGSLAVEGPLLTWVADHRRHHKYSDREGDPHSPWRFGDDWKALLKGLLFAHMGWMFDHNKTIQSKFIRNEWEKDPTVRAVSLLFPLFVVISLLGPPALGYWWSGGSLHAALTALLWGTFVRMGLMHHVTWSINSICHTFGKAHFKVRDKSRNVGWLAVLSFGESWHNLHHCDPTCARHGVLKGQIDINARCIWVYQKLRLAKEVNWPDAGRLARKRVAAA